jgi:hypothetical protein
LLHPTYGDSIALDAKDVAAIGLDHGITAEVKAEGYLQTPAYHGLIVPTVTE